MAIKNRNKQCANGIRNKKGKKRRKKIYVLHGH